MIQIFRKKSRVFALLSLGFLAQCCCCILPIGWQVNQGSPAAQQVQYLLDLLQSGLMALR